ncbi:MAG: MATE family efflux transporter [Deltaproteobacteria bacterium]|nr:MATE family efflux transporter [Deltaproteobacteria bacterium]
MLLGIASIMIFNLVDTWFISKLGTEALAAISFTFPVVFVVGGIAVGMGIGATALIAEAIGTGDRTRVCRLSTDAMLLGLLVVAAATALIYFNIDPIFRALGAGPEVLPTIVDYMEVWTLGVICLVVPMVGNGLLRAAGDVKRPAMIMTLAALINAGLDPLLIFGLGPFPALGVRGAAIATVFARAAAMLASLYLVGWRERLLTWRGFSVKRCWASWRALLSVAGPSALAQLAVPLGAAIITRLIARHGNAAVAALGAGSRIEMVLLLPLLAMSSAMTPLVAQNFGARRTDRIRQALALTSRFSLLLGAAGYLLIFFAAPFVAQWFSADPTVIALISLFLRTTPFGYGLRGLGFMFIATLNATRAAKWATLIVVIRTPLLIAAFALIGGALLGAHGVFFGLTLADLLVGGVAAFAAKFYIDRLKQRTAPP